MKGRGCRTGLISLGSAVRIRLSLPKIKNSIMKKLSLFCLTLNPEHEKIIKDLSLIPVGLGNKKFPLGFFTDKQNENISIKNPFYGEYTFHYWIWKNYIDKINSEWIGFCQYRKFFVLKKVNVNNLSLNELKKNLLTNLNDEFKNYDCILGEKFSVENFKNTKILKKHLFHFLKSPKALFFKKNRTLLFHFDLFHGKGNLEKAIDLLDSNNRNEFRKFVKNNTSFNPHNMFICRTKLLKSYYCSVFPWLKKCEKIFGFNNLEGYGMKRIYGFLAERYLSYWFLKNCKVKELPIIVKDISDYKNL